MKSSGTENIYPDKPRSNRSWIILIVLIIGLPLLLYYGYCWGIWGRNSLSLQYLFQCNCPPASEEARYSDDVDVIVSACSHVSTILSPSGRLVFIREKDSGLTFDYLLDLQTGNELPFPIPENGGFYFLTDDLLCISSSYDENYVLDRTTGNQYPIQRFSSLRSDAYIGGHANLILLAETLRQAKYVFFREYDDTIVALAHDFPTSVENNIVLNRFGIPGENPNRTEQFLKENDIVYHIIPAAFPGEVISPDGRFVAREDGI